MQQMKRSRKSERLVVLMLWTGVVLTGGAKDQVLTTEANVMVEVAFKSSRTYADPFNQVTLDVTFIEPQGPELRVPAFWAGSNVWKVRYASAVVGTHPFRSDCSELQDQGLHGITGKVEIHPYAGGNPLYVHGGLHVASSGRYLEHLDHTPFFWLGDTWWMGLCHRLRWPEEFRTLAADRKEKGFNVIQIVAGLYPDMPPFDPRGANEAGYPWETNYARIRPEYFDAADQRLGYLVEQGFTPCIVGAWGYFLPWMGVPKLKQHWRNIIARWGAYPVIWCLAGEGAMPYYLTKTWDKDVAVQKHGWTELGRYVRSIDSFHRLITIHPTDNARDQVDDPAVIDFDMMQTGHRGRKSIPGTVNQVTGALARSPRMPVLVGEVSYESLLGSIWQDVERFMFWTSILNGAGGHTYGANGIWQVNTAEHPYGPSPYGGCWGDTPWDTAYQLPGSQQLGLAKALLMRYAWWRLEPHPEWVSPHWSKEDYELPYAAGIPGELRVIFIPLLFDPPKVKSLELGVAYRAFYFDPSTGNQRDLGKVEPDATGTWQAPLTPTFKDWVLVLEKIT